MQREHSRHSVFATDAGIKEYTHIDIRPGMQVVEVGPGLGAFSPWLAKNAKRFRIPPPIAIDCMDYVVVEALLERALAQELADPVRAHAEGIRERMKILRSPAVRLYSMLLGFATKLEELAGKADIVVDINGAISYAELEVPGVVAASGRGVDNVRELENMLLKPGGHLHTQDDK
ncbi:MAG: hypothetical protein ABIA93_04270 [Candidatus Woesearchaeota archaeon]